MCNFGFKCLAVLCSSFSTVSLHISVYTVHYSARNIRKAIENVGDGFEQNTVWSHRFLLKLVSKEQRYLKLYFRSEYADGHPKKRFSNFVRPRPGNFFFIRQTYNISVYMIHPASYSMGTKSISAGIKRPEGETNHSNTFCIEVSAAIPVRSLQAFMM